MNSNGACSVNDWQKEIGVMIYVKDAISKLDVDRVFKHHLPKVAASEDRIRAAETALGYALDERYVAFLRWANGWPGFFHHADLFGTEELCGSVQMESAKELISATASEVFESSGVRTDELLPIAVSSADLDLFVLMKPNSAKPGMVIWFAGGEVQRFPNFDEFFLAMVDYNRLDYQSLKKDRAWH